MRFFKRKFIGLAILILMFAGTVHSDIPVSHVWLSPDKNYSIQSISMVVNMIHYNDNEDKIFLLDALKNVLELGDISKFRAFHGSIEKGMWTPDSKFWELHT